MRRSRRRLADGDGAERRLICGSKSASPSLMGRFGGGAEAEDSRSEPPQKSRPAAFRRSISKPLSLQKTICLHNRKKADGSFIVLLSAKRARIGQKYYNKAVSAVYFLHMKY